MSFYFFLAVLLANLLLTVCEPAVRNSARDRHPHGSASRPLRCGKRPFAPDSPKSRRCIDTALSRGTSFGDEFPNTSKNRDRPGRGRRSPFETSLGISPSAALSRSDGCAKTASTETRRPSLRGRIRDDESLLAVPGKPAKRISDATEREVSLDPRSGDRLPKFGSSTVRNPARGTTSDGLSSTSERKAYYGARGST